MKYVYYSKYRMLEPTADDLQATVGKVLVSAKAFSDSKEHDKEALKVVKGGLTHLYEAGFDEIHKETLACVCLLIPTWGF